MKVQNILKKKPYLAWDTDNIENLSEEAVLERILNYGDWEDVQQFIKIKGKKKTAQIFKSTLSKKRTNYDPAIAHYFSRYFKVK